MSDENGVNELERGFICRVIYTRGGKTMPQMVSEAKSFGVVAEWFSDPSCRVVWKSVESVFSKRDFNKATIFTIVKEIPRIVADTKDDDEGLVKIGMEFFTDSERFVREDDDLSSYATLLRDAYIAAETKRVMAETAENLSSGEMTGAAALSLLMKHAQDVLSSQNQQNKLSLSALCDQAVGQYREAYHQIVELGNYEYTPGIPLPWRKLAYSINGFGADLFILAARPGVGKTSMAMNFTRFWLDQGLKVVFDSIDMSPLGFVKRQLAEKTRISSRQMQFAKSDDFESDIRRIEEEAKTLKELEENKNFSLYTEYDVDALKANCSILKDQGLIDVLVVDYLQLMTCKGGSRMSTTQKVTYVSNTLHSLAVELGIPVLCLSQLNRDNTKDGGRDPQLQDLRDSGAIEQDAAVVMLLYRDEKLYSKWKDEAPPCQFFKNRQAPSGRTSYCPVWCLLAKCREGDAGTKIPFVVIQNKFAWYQADAAAQGDACFDKVYDDWRHASIEKIWEENGALIKMDDIRSVEQFNINKNRREKGLSEIDFSNRSSAATTTAEKQAERKAESEPVFGFYDVQEEEPEEEYETSAESTEPPSETNNDEQDSQECPF